MNINLELYRIFCAVAECKSFSEAAKQLYISQPAVTQRISNLEKQLNVKLFYRDSSGVRTTKEGEKLYQYVKYSIEKMNNIEFNFDKMLNNRRNKILTIKISNDIENIFIYKQLVEFSKKYPRIGIRIEKENSRQAIDELEAGKVDFVIVNSLEKIRKQNIEKVLEREFEGCFFTSKEYIEKNNGCINIFNNTKDYVYILPQGDKIERQMFNKFCQKYNLRITSKYEAESINIRKFFVKSGIGISFGIKEELETEFKKKELIEIKTEGKMIKCSLCIVTRKNDTEKKEGFNEFLELIKVG